MPLEWRGQGRGFTVSVVESILNIAEIKAKYPSLWILLEDIQTGENHDVLAGRPVAASQDKLELFRILGERKPRFSTIVYGGEWRPKMEYVM